MNVNCFICGGLVDSSGEAAVLGEIVYNYLLRMIEAPMSSGAVSVSSPVPKYTPNRHAAKCAWSNKTGCIVGARVEPVATVAV